MCPPPADGAARRSSRGPRAGQRTAFAGTERLHLIGLVSDGGVHSGWGHLEALIKLGAELGVEDLVLHAFTDGRDTLPHGGVEYRRAEHTAASGPEAARAAYEREETDEFITPVRVGDEARIRPGDSVIGFNFRPDRMREITRCATPACWQMSRRPSWHC